MDISTFTTKQLELLALELQEDLASTREALSSLAPATLARNGLAILHLLPASQRTGLGGKTILELEPDPSIGSTSLTVSSSAGIRPGDIVRVEEQPAGSATKWTKREIKAAGVEGVVQFVKESSVGIVLGDNDEDALDKLVGGGKRLWVVKGGSEVVYRRMEKAVRMLGEAAVNGKETTLARVLFGLSKPDPPKEVDIEFFDEGLNDSQKEAVRFAVGSPQLALVHGPPGTGKTQTLIEIIRQLAEKQNLKIFVCAPSNIAVDNIVLRLPSALPAVRVGHPARLLPKVLARSLDILTKTSEEAQIVSDVRKDVDDKLASLMAKGKGRLKGRARGEGWKDLRELRQEFRQREAKCITQLVGRSKVVLATLHGAGARQLFGHNFDVVLIDEASQALEAQCWIPLLNAKKLVLAGDHLQLPPTVKSETNNKSSKKSKKPEPEADTKDDSNIPSSLTTTLFSRLQKLYGPSIKRLLITQYRMHKSIMEFPSLALYENKLVAAPQVATHLLVDLDHVEATDDTKEPVVFYDTQGGDFPESDETNDENPKALMGSESKSNPNEVLLCKYHLKTLLDAGVKEDEIAIISGYSAQVSLLVSSIRSDHPGVEIGTVDGFQGREKEAIILTLVRSNDKREIGFLREKRRLNVAMTRARRHLCVIGDGETLSKEKGFVKDWVGWLEENADVRFPDLAEISGY